VVFCSFNFPAFSQVENNRNQPAFFNPKNHNPDILKSGQLPEKSFYQRKGEWQHIIDSTWGPGDSLSRKLQIFNIYAKEIHDYFDGFKSQNLNYDSLYNHYIVQINDSTSMGAFSSIMSHFAYDLKDLNTRAYDNVIASTIATPGVPILFLGTFFSRERFGAVTTVLPDSTTLVLRVAPDQPLNLKPGDIILGYEGVPWKNLVKELLNAGLPMVAYTGGCKSADSHLNLSTAGLNWHLFNTIDIVQYSTGDTLHLSVLPLKDFKGPFMVNNEQMAIKNIPFPKFNDSSKPVTYGILDNSNKGYIYLANQWDVNIVESQLYQALNELKNTDALIIDLRYFTGGYFLSFEKAFNMLFNESLYTVEHVYRCNTNTYELSCVINKLLFQITGTGLDYYDKPIAVLMGPGGGGIIAHQLIYHPMVKFFGKSSASGYGHGNGMDNVPNWTLTFSGSDLQHVSKPGVFLNHKEFPIDYPVWFNKDDVAKGIDPIVEKSLEWMDNLVFGHNVTINNGLFSPAGETVTINAIVENPNLHELSVKLIFESLDGSIVDSTDMAEFSNDVSLFNWQGKWKTPGISENTYWVSLNVKDLSDGSSFNNKHATRITTTGPVVLDSISIKKSSSYYLVKPFIKNVSAVTSIKKPTVKIICTDPWVLPITLNIKDSHEIAPGKIETIASPFQVKYIDSVFAGYFNFKFEIASDGWPYWTIDTTIAVIPTGTEQLPFPLAFRLEQNYPNPFSSFTTFNWQITENSKVTLKVIDIVGRTVAILVDERRSQGKYETQLDASHLPQGIYFYQLKAGEFIQTRKMIIRN
jgi:hypothetical protein